MAEHNGEFCYRKWHLFTWQWRPWLGIVIALTCQFTCYIHSSLLSHAAEHKKYKNSCPGVINAGISCGRLKSRALDKLNFLTVCLLWRWQPNWRGETNLFFCAPSWKGVPKLVERSSQCYRCSWECWRLGRDTTETFLTRRRKSLKYILKTTDSTDWHTWFVVPVVTTMTAPSKVVVAR